MAGHDLALAAVVVSAALISVISSLSVLTSLLYPDTTKHPLRPWMRPATRSNAPATASIRYGLLPAQRLQLRLACLDIAIVVISALCLHGIVFGDATAPASPFVNAATTIGLGLCLLVRPSMICAFAANSLASIWLDRSVASELALFLPAVLASAVTACIGAVLVHIYSDVAYDSGMSAGQAAASAWMIASVAALVVASTLSLGGIIWAVWLSGQEHRGRYRRNKWRLGRSEAIELRERPVAERRSSSHGEASRMGEAKAEFGAKPPAGPSSRTFGTDARLDYPTSSLNTAQRIDEALQGTLVHSEQSESAARGRDAPGTANKSSTLASTADPYDTWSRRPALPQIDNHPAEGAFVHQPRESDRALHSADIADFSVKYTFDPDYDGSFAASDHHLNDLPGPTDHLGDDREHSRRSASDFPIARSTKLSVASTRSALMIARMRSTGFVLLNSKEVRRAAAGQGYGSTAQGSTGGLGLDDVRDVEKGNRWEERQEKGASLSSAASSLSSREALKAISRLTGLILGVWLPFPLFLPYLTNGWTAGPNETTATASVLLLCLAFTITSPLMVTQGIVTRLLDYRRGPRAASTTRPQSTRSDGDADSSMSSIGVAGVGFGACNGYDFGLHSELDINQASQAGRRATFSSAVPLRYSKGDTFGQGRGSVDALSVGQPAKGNRGSTATSASRTPSVPFSQEHWAGKRGSGDRVEPRSPFWRAVNVMLSPRPRLEVLGPESDDLQSRASCLPKSAEQTFAASPQPNSNVWNKNDLARPTGPAAHVMPEVPEPYPMLALPTDETSWGRLRSSSPALSLGTDDALGTSSLFDELDVLLQPRSDDAGEARISADSREARSSDNRASSTSRDPDTREESIVPLAGMQAGEGTADPLSKQELHSTSQLRLRSPRRANSELSSDTVLDSFQDSQRLDAQFSPRSSGLTPQSRIPSEEPLVDCTLSESLSCARTETDTPGQARSHGRSLSESSLAAGTPSVKGSRNGTPSSLSRASLSFGSGQFGSILAQLSGSSGRHKHRSVISDTGPVDLPAYEVLAKGKEREVPAIHSTSQDSASSGRSSSRRAQRQSRGVSMSVEVEIQVKEEKSSDSKYEQKARSIASDLSQSVKSKLSLAKYLGLGGSRRSSASGKKQTLLGESLGLTPVLRRPLSNELGLDQERTDAGRGEDLEPVAGQDGPPLQELATPASQDNTFSSGHRRQDTIGSISVLSSCMSEEIIISPDPSPQKPRDVEVVGAEFDQPASLVMPREPRGLPAVAEEEEPDCCDSSSEIYGSAQPYDCVDDVPAAMERDPLSFFREQFPVRILSPVLEASEDESSIRTGVPSTPGDRSRKTISLLSLTPASASASLRSISALRVERGGSDWTPSPKTGLKRSISLNSPSRTQKDTVAPISPYEAQRLLLHHVQRTPDRSLSQMLRGTDERLDFASLLRSAAMGTSTPRSKRASQCLSELSFDESIWSRSPPPLHVRASPHKAPRIEVTPAAQIDDDTGHSTETKGQDRGVERLSDHADAANVTVDLPTSSTWPSLAEAASRGASRAKRRSTASLQLLASSGASAVSAWKDLRLRNTDGPNKERRRSKIGSPFDDIRTKLRKLERKTSVLKSHSGVRPATSQGDAVKRPRKSRGRVAIMTDRHHFKIVDVEDSFVDIVPADEK